MKLTEAQKYHSIHSQGQTVHDAIENLDDSGEDSETAHDTIQMDTIGPTKDGADDADLELLEDGELKDIGSERIEDNPTKAAPTTAGSERTHNEARRDQHPSVPDVPIAVAQGGQDEALKNLMMSWYYAGYYTGLYEGQALQKGHPTE